MAQNKTINQSIQNMINTTIKTQPCPTKAIITQTYNDGHVDINTKPYGKLTYIESITKHEIDDITILIFLDNDFNTRMVI